MKREKQQRCNICRYNLSELSEAVFELLLLLFCCCNKKKINFTEIIYQHIRSLSFSFFFFNSLHPSHSNSLTLSFSLFMYTTCSDTYFNITKTQSIETKGLTKNAYSTYFVDITLFFWRFINIKLYNTLIKLIWCVTTYLVCYIILIG